MSEDQFNCHNITQRKDVNKDELSSYLNDGWTLLKITVGEQDKPYTVGLDQSK
ncbi:hypothetical protein [Peribacillus saganii]|uniref:hypothetical protein n=1 Tax=Peribacillus saganii TaxID=2303992 RepID=UPI00131436CE|nr:hypothetical protein [Peribacillus saganii]